MTAFRIVAAAALTECACSSGRGWMVQAALAANVPVSTELVKTNLEPFGIEVREVGLDWIERHGATVLLVELAVECPASIDVRMSSVVANAFESIRRSARVGEEEHIHKRVEVLSNLERETTDLSRYVDSVTTSVLEHGAAPRTKKIVAEIESVSVEEINRDIDGLLSPENIEWECCLVSHGP